MESYRIFEENNKVVLFDTENFNWYRMSKEYFQTKKEELIVGHSEKKKNPQKSIKIIYLSLTRKCNMACEFCSTKSGPDIDTTEELTFENICEKLIPLLKKIEPHNLILSGGEPLTRTDIFDIINILKTHLPKTNIVLQTNGLLLNNSRLERLKNKIEYIEISIEDMFYNKSFYKSLSEVLGKIKKFEIPMQLSYVVTRDNVKYMREVLRIVQEYNSPILLRFVSPVGQAVNKKISFMYAEDIKKFYLDMIDYVIEENCTDENILNLVLPPLQVTESCGAYGRMLYMNSKGQFSMCSGLEFPPYVLGNIHDGIIETYSKRIENILKLEEVKKKLLVDKMPYCQNCEIKYFCCGLCAVKTYNTSDKKILYAECAIKKNLVYFWLFDFDKKATLQENLRILKERILNIYDK